MAKKSRGSADSDSGLQLKPLRGEDTSGTDKFSARALPNEEDSSSMDQTATMIGEGLGNFLNHAEGQWRAWRDQRDSVVKSLRMIRDKATALLKEAGDEDSIRPAARNTSNAASELPAGRKSGRAGKGRKRSGMTEEGRRRIAEAQRARWARLKASKQNQ